MGKWNGAIWAHVIAVNMHDVEILLDLPDEGIEQAGHDIDVMEFDRHRDDGSGMPEQVFENAILAALDVHLHENRALRRQAAEGIFDGCTVVLIVTPDPLSEVNAIRPEKKGAVDPAESPWQRACPEQQEQAHQLADRVLKGRQQRDRVVVAVNQRFGIMALEIALKSPVMGKAEREQGAGCPYRLERDDISAIIRASDACKGIAGDGMKIGQPDGVTGLRPGFCG